MSVNIGEIHSFRQSGVGDMGSVEKRYNGVGRFRLNVKRWVVVYYRIRFGQAWDPTSGAAVTAPTLNANFAMRVDHRARTREIGGDGTDGTPVEVIPWSFAIHKSDAVGATATDVNVRLTDEEMQANIMTREEWAVATWTNPHSDGSLKWFLEVGLAALQ